MKLKGDSYKWIRGGQGEIPFTKVSRQERQIAADLEADYLKEHGCYPTGFTLKGGGVGTIPAAQYVEVKEAKPC